MTESDVIFLTAIAKGLHEVEIFALGWIPSRQYIGSHQLRQRTAAGSGTIDRCQGIGGQQEVGRSCTNPLRRVFYRLQKSFRIRPGARGLRRSSTAPPPASRAATGHLATRTCFSARLIFPSQQPFRPNVINRWNFRRWRRSQYRQHPSPGQGRPGRQWEKLSWM